MFKLHITNSYGELIYKKTTKLQRLNQQAASAKNRWIFLTRCVVHHVIPKSFRTRPVLRTTKARNVTNSYDLHILKIARDEAKLRYHVLLHNIQQLTDVLRNDLAVADFEVVQRITETSRERRFVSENERLKLKFENLSGSIDRKSRSANDKVVKTAILNLTNRQLPEHHQQLLNLGPKFVPAIRRVPVVDIVTSVESVAASMNSTTDLIHQGEKLRHDVSSILMKYVDKKLPSNLSSQQQQALRELKQECNTKVVPFDKGTGFVLISEEDMFRKIQEQLGEAKQIDKDPTSSLVTKFQRVISRLRKEDKLNTHLFYSMYPSDAIPPRLYGLVKAHKESKGYPMRTVVSTIGTAFHGTSAYLVELLQPTLNKNEIRVKNSSSFVEQAGTWTIDSDEIQVSYDVVALYPSVPIKRAIDAIMIILENDLLDLRSRTKLDMDDIRELLQLCLSKCYFLWNDKFYLIDDAGPIGLSLMVVVAEAYLQHLEDIAIRTALHTNVAPKSYRRYVDDSHARFTSMENASSFLEILNSQDEQIQYTMECEQTKGELSFLDITIRNTGHGNYEFAVYRKDAITNVQVKPNSSVDPNMYVGIFKGFLARATRICSPQHLKAEIEFLINVFDENGYDREKLISIADKYTNRSNNNVTDTTSNEQQLVKLPWIPVVGPKLRAALRKYNIKTVFTSGESLKDILCKHKSKLPRNSHPGVYSIPCGCGCEYIGETKKRITTRLMEHEKDIFHGRWKQSGAAEHASKCDDSFNFDGARTIAIEANYRRRKIREALEIRRTARTGSTIVNREAGNICTTNAWNVLLSRSIYK